MNDDLRAAAQAATPDYPEHFWNRVQKGDGCWAWMGKHARNLYGTYWWRGFEYRAHRIAWLLTNGPIPEGLWVLHRCDNPSCVNPSHLFLGTHQDNMDDAKAKGRSANGAMRHPTPTHCPQGHSYAEWGIRPGKARKLSCRACMNARARAYQASRRAALEGKPAPSSMTGGE